MSSASSTLRAPRAAGGPLRHLRLLRLLRRLRSRLTWGIAHELYVAADRVEVLVRGALIAAHPRPADDIGALRSIVQDICSSRAGRVRVLLSGGLARPLLAGPIAGLRNWVEAEAAVAAAAPEATGLAGPCHVWLQAWPGDRAALAVAMDRALLDALMDAVRSAGCVLASVQPWWNDAIAGHAAASAARVFAAEDEEASTLLGHAETWTLAQSLCPPPSESELERALGRLRVSGALGDAQWVRVPRGAAAAADEGLPAGVQA